MKNLKKILQKILLKQIFVNKRSSKESIVDAISSIRPVISPYSLLMVGGERDGGYLIPDDLSHIKYCMSPGVGGSNSFEIDLYDRYSIRSLTADASVDGLPDEHHGVGFIKKFVGSKTSVDYITIENWIDESCGDEPGDLLFQMDIEGGEYDVLINMDPSTLKKFRIIAIEWHNFDLLLDRYGVEILASVFRKIGKYFNPICIHPNNVTGFYNIDGVIVPKTLEVVYLRKDRFPTDIKYHSKETHSKIKFVKNDPNKPEIKLSSHWFAS